MKNTVKTFAVVGVATLVSTSALAGISAIKDMSNGEQVTFTGKVESVNNEREFTLRDSTGTIDVDIESNQSVVLKKGMEVTVSGKVDKDITGTDINATKVDVHKNMVEAVGDAIEKSSSVSLEGATAYDIKNLPKEGLVKVSGTVSDVDNEKEFTLKDSTGRINIDIESEERVALTEGAEVTVIGYMDSGLMGKSIDATKVMVVADATPMAKSKPRY